MAIAYGGRTHAQRIAARTPEDWARLEAFKKRVSLESLKARYSPKREVKSMDVLNTGDPWAPFPKEYQEYYAEGIPVDYARIERDKYVTRLTDVAKAATVGIPPLGLVTGGISPTAALLGAGVAATALALPAAGAAGLGVAATGGGGTLVATGLKLLQVAGGSAAIKAVLSWASKNKILAALIAAAGAAGLGYLISKFVTSDGKLKRRSRYSIGTNPRLGTLIKVAKRCDNIFLRYNKRAGKFARRTRGGGYYAHHYHKGR